MKLKHPIQVMIYHQCKMPIPKESNSYTLIYPDWIIYLLRSNQHKMDEKHIIYTYKNEVHEAYKKWSFERIEKVLTRLGATYWEIG